MNTYKYSPEHNISVRVLADSISPAGIRMITIEAEYPRFILAEVNTHRMLSKNSASSRAIPQKSMHESIKNNPAMPVYWGKNQAGMSAKEELSGPALEGVKCMWIAARDVALSYARTMFDSGLHKQISNRITEPWMMMKSVISGTEWTNLLYLRNHPDAQPEFRALAECIEEAIKTSKPRLLQPGEWHLPYIKTYHSPIDGHIVYADENDNVLTLEDAQKISASCCAQVSYRKNDGSLDKAEDIIDKLINSKPMHASPVEHQATPMVEHYAEYFDDIEWVPGVSHVDRFGHLWSGNLKGWIQFRKTLPGEAVW